jgi:hypothetical protein
MDREQFWALIEAAKTATGGDCQAQAGQLVAALTDRSVDEALAWDRIYGELMAESYRWELWGAAFLINGGCGDDGFDYFRFGLRSLHSRRAGGRLPPPGAGCCRRSRRTGACRSCAPAHAQTGLVPNDQSSARGLGLMSGASRVTSRNPTL